MFIVLNIPELVNTNRTHLFFVNFILLFNLSSTNSFNIIIVLVNYIQNTLVYCQYYFFIKYNLIKT